MPGNTERENSINLENAVQLSEKLVNEISGIKTDCLLKFPVGNYIEEISRYPEISSYRYVSPEISRLCRELTAHSPSILYLYHKLVLVNFILQTGNPHLLKKFPQDIRSFFYRDFARILKNISSGNTGSFSYSDDRFCKDIAICSLRMIPAGVQKIHLSRLPRRFLFHSMRQFTQGAFLLLAELGGFAPLYEIHTDIHDDDLETQFSATNWNIFYKRISGLLKINPRIRGMFGGSWFYDPLLDVISPHLAYLRSVPLGSGAKLFYLGPNKFSIKDATFKSKKRRDLYEKGRYVPTNYLLVWPREKLIRWAEGAD